MPETHEVRSVVEAAEQAAAAGDYLTAEVLLRDALVRQEASLGPLHPDLANTLNNLGVVSEIIDKPENAERCFRRAYAIAAAALEPDHPSVVTSEKNLRDFCNARGKPFQPSSALSDIAHTPPPTASFRPIEASRFTRRTTRGVLAIGLALLVLVAARLWFTQRASVGLAGRGEDARASAGAGTIAGPVTPPPVERPTPVPQSPAAAGSPAAAETPRAGEGAVQAETSRRGGPSVGALPTVTEASLCLNLSTSAWRCDPASGPVTSGRLFFYTRVQSRTNTMVQHRWYRGDRLQQSMDLRVPATASGYRTYSRATVDRGTPGDWRVAITTSKGDVLHEERFTVR